ncbi:MAG: glycosyltransferase family 2 protein [Bacillota bacterium]
MSKQISVLMPAYNEADRIKESISAVKKLDEIDELIVINDGSTDRTGEIVKQLEVELIELEKNQGKGAALNRGLAAATGQILVLLDGDLGSTASEVKKLLAPVMTGEVGMTIAQFPPPVKKGGLGLVTNLAQLGLKFFTGLKFSTPLSGQRVIRREIIEELGGFESGFGVEVALTIRAIKAGYKVQEVAVTMKHRETGRDWAGFKHRGAQFMDVLAVLGRQLKESS